jgi:GT2 family glycosyltransferase
MDLSVIIPVFNGATIIADQLEALATQTLSESFEVVVSDNGSTDESLSVVQRYIDRVPGLRIIDASDRRGRSHARNVGAQAASGEALAFCDQDDIVGSGWVHAMTNAFSEYDFVTGSIETNRLNEPWRVKHFSFPQHNLYTHKVPPYLSHAPGCNLGVKRSLHQAVGGFDESFMLAWEDTDYAWRLQLAGHQLHFVPDAVVHYRLPHGLTAIFRQGRNYGEGNVLFYKKYESVAKISEPWKVRIGYWTRLLRPKTLLGLRSKANLALWLWQYGWRIGHLRGCRKHRILAPSIWL